MSTGDHQNPVAFSLHRCFYCGGSKPDAIRDSDGTVIYRLMYFDVVPLPHNNGSTELKQISICDDCME